MDRSSYRLDLMDAKGKKPLKTFHPDKEGVADGIVASHFPLNGCDTATWSGRPDLIGALGGQVVRAFIQTDTGIHPVFYGALVTGDKEEPDDDLSNYEANARTLLDAQPVPGVRYRNMDTAAIAFDVCVRFRHEALRVRASDFPPSGTPLDSFLALGPLGEVLDELLEATEDATFGCGLDPSGYLFFKPNVLEYALPYEATDYEDLEVVSAALQTAILWSFSREPGITPYGGSYSPAPFTYLSVPDRALHEEYGYTRFREIPDLALQEGYNTAYTSANFSNPGGAVRLGGGPAVRAAAAAGTFTLTNDDPLVLGVRIKYQTSEDAGAVRLRASCGQLYDVELPNTRGEEQELDIPLTPHETGFTKWHSFRLTAAAGGTMSLLGFYPLRVNTDILDKATKPVVPEQRPTQASLPGIRPNAALLDLEGAPMGTRQVPSAGLRYVWSKTAGAETVYDIGASAYEVAEGKTEAVRGYYRKPG